jgi:hypothetical protein
VSRNIINSKGTSVGKIVGSAIFDLQGHKLYALRGVNIYKLSGESWSDIQAMPTAQVRG